MRRTHHFLEESPKVSQFLYLFVFSLGPANYQEKNSLLSVAWEAKALMPPSWEPSWGRGLGSPQAFISSPSFRSVSHPCWSPQDQSLWFGFSRNSYHLSPAGWCWAVPGPQRAGKVARGVTAPYTDSQLFPLPPSYRPTF